MVATLELDEDVLGLVAELHLGINIDPAAVTHPSVLMASTRRAFGAFVGACTPGELASIPAIGPGR